MSDQRIIHELARIASALQSIEYQLRQISAKLK